MAGQGSGGNVLAAICSFFVPGLGQLVQGRVLSAVLWFLFACAAFAITWLITLSLLPFGWWRLLRAETSCNFYWGEAWVQRCHDDLDAAWWHINQVR